MSIFTHGSSGSTSLLDTKVDHGKRARSATGIRSMAFCLMDAGRQGG